MTGCSFKQKKTLRVFLFFNVPHGEFFVMCYKYSKTSLTSTILWLRRHTAIPNQCLHISRLPFSPSLTPTGKRVASLLLQLFLIGFVRFKRVYRNLGQSLGKAVNKGL